jgi:hypothetical protein
MLRDGRVGSRMARQKPDVAVAALVQNPIAHHELIASALFGSCCRRCRIRPASRPMLQGIPGVTRPLRQLRSPPYRRHLIQPSPAGSKGPILRRRAERLRISRPGGLPLAKAPCKAPEPLASRWLQTPGWAGVDAKGKDSSKIRRLLQFAVPGSSYV